MLMLLDPLGFREESDVDTKWNQICYLTFMSNDGYLLRHAFQQNCFYEYHNL